MKKRDGAGPYAGTYFTPRKEVRTGEAAMKLSNENYMKKPDKSNKY